MLHPFTHIIITLTFAAIAVGTPLEEGLAVLLFGLGMTLTIPSRTGTHLVRPFLTILAVALLFLFLIHGVRWNPPGITRPGLFDAAKSFIRIGAPVISALYLSRQIQSEELFSFLLDMNVPTAAILILFRTIWLVPRLTDRMEETLLALKLRGMPMETLIQRIRAIIPALGTIFASMFAEISDNSLTIAARGFLNSGHKSHVLKIRFRVCDGATIVIALLILGIVWF